MARTEYGTTWWGQQWLAALSNIDLDNRIPRGKSYANTGKVLSFKIEPAKRLIKAKVEGHYDPYYRVRIALPPFSDTQVKKLIKKIANSPLVLAKLASRQLDPEVLNICQSLGIRLFPSSWKDLDMECSCPDYAVPCKHIAAVIYILSKEIDANPFILFTLRGIDLIKELEKEGVQIKRAKKAELPTWLSFLNRTNRLVKPIQLEPYEVSTPEGRKAWLDSLNKLTFTKVSFDPESILKVLPEQPAGYIHGDLRALTGKVIKAAAKIAKEQIRNTSERTPPVFTGEHEMVCVNTWGQTRVNEELSWEEFDAAAKGLVRRKIGESRPDGSVVAYHEMFSGYINRKRLSSSPELIEALYDAWMVASKLVSAGAIVPLIYQPVTECFAVKWLPASSEESIGELTARLGYLLKGMDNKNFEILRAPEDIDDQVLGEIVLSGFIQSYVEKAFTKLTGTDRGICEQAALFAGKVIDIEDDQGATAARLRLTDWLSSLTIAREELLPVITVTDLWGDEKAGSAKEAFERSIAIELGFNIERSKGRQKSIDYFTFEEFMIHDELAGYKFDAMKISSKLSEHCPELYDLLRDSRARTLLTMEQLTPLVFESLPALSLLGVSLVLPKTLQSLLKPSVNLELELNDDWDESTGLLGLASLLNFDWKIAVGDKKITAEEQARLFREAGKIVRFHDEFLFVDPAQISQIKKKLAGKNVDLSRMGLIRAMLSGQTEDSDVILGDSVKEALAKLFKDADAPLPPTINAKLRDYQERGYRWMIRNMKIGVGSILADDMGLGKTLQVLSVLESMRHREEFKEKPALVVVPTTLLTNWMREAQKFTPELKILPYYGTQRSLGKDKADVVLTTYGTLRRASDIKKMDFKLLVLDEAQAIKNHKTTTWKSVSGLKADHCIAMSGTPVENRLLEYWSIMQAANPGLLGTERNFKKQFADPIEVKRDSNVADQFKRLTEPFILRRLKSDKSIIKDLPDKIVKDDYCTLTPEQAALYQKTVDKNLALVQEGMNQFERSALVIQMITQLKQICNAPVQFEKSSPYKGPEFSGKMERLFAILDDLFEADKKVLIFTQFRQMGHLLEHWLEERYGETPHFIHGGLSVKDRQAYVDSFQNDRSKRMMILSLKAAGTGLNLTAASAVIHFDLWWNPAVENQATDRAYRIGQKQNVTVYRFITANSFEEKINELIESKKALAEMTVATGEHWITELNDQQLQEIFTLSAARN